jgi:hypothetical protein
MKFGKIFVAAVVAFAVVGQVAYAQEDEAVAVESEAEAEEELIPAAEVGVVKGRMVGGWGRGSTSPPCCVPHFSWIFQLEPCPHQEVEEEKPAPVKEVPVVASKPVTPPREETKVQSTHPSALSTLKENLAFLVEAIFRAPVRYLVNLLKSLFGRFIK